MRHAALLLILAILLGACGLFGSGTVAMCGWSGTTLAFQGHTTLGDAGLPAVAGVGRDQPGELVVTANPVPLPGGAPDFSAAPTDTPSARMYCFHPDGRDMVVRAVLPSDWVPPDSSGG